LAEVAKPTTAYYGCAVGNKCLPMALKSGDPVVISRAEGDWTCGYLVARKGSAQGWVRSSDIRTVNSDSNPPLTAWVGTWAQGENRITIQRSRTSGKLDLEGEAYWFGPLHNGGHIGNISGEASPIGNHLHYTEEDICTVDFALLGKYILANDNNMCGGVNVRFWGVWKRAAAR